MVIGSIYMFAGSTAPAGFLLCDGSAVSRTTYASLFDVIGTTYGAGDDSTTFNLPDISGKVPIGVSASHALATTGGEESHALTSTEIPSHTHGIAAHGHGNTIKATTPKFVHSITQPSFTYTHPNGTAAFGTASSTTAYTSKSATASRTTNVAVTAHAAANCTMSGAITDCNAFNMETTGDGTAHDNMQPYLTINYVIYAGA